MGMIPAECEGDTADEATLMRLLYKKEELTGYRHAGAMMQQLSQYISQ